jgi:hypothetical protein
MKYTIALLMLSMAGCVLTPPAAPTVTAPAQPGPAAPVPVRAEQITPENAQKMSQALADELDRDAQRQMTPLPR